MTISNCFTKVVGYGGGILLGTIQKGSRKQDKKDNQISPLPTKISLM
jgi:hypothetical protein